MHLTLVMVLLDNRVDLKGTYVLRPINRGDIILIKGHPAKHCRVLNDNVLIHATNALVAHSIFFLVF